MKKNFTAHIIFASTALASQQVLALGFGRVMSDAVLGQSLTFTVPVNVDPGERFGTDCMSALVYYGESQLLPSQVRTDLERGAADNTWIVKITATVPVQEPIIEVALSAGCERRFTRRFSVFADPPTLGTTAAQLPQVAPMAGGTLPAKAPATGAAGDASPGTPPGRSPTVTRGASRSCGRWPPARRNCCSTSPSRA